MVMVRYGDNQYRGNITGASAAYLRIQNSAIRLLAGSVFTSEQYQDKARVILLGPTLLRTLFNGDPNAAIGSTVQIGRQNFDVIGTIGPAGGSMALVPMTTARAYLFGGMRTVGGANVLATSLGTVDAAIDQVNSILDREHFLKNSAQRDFSVTRFDQTGPMVGDLVTLLRWFAAAATGIALFIGALGLANIMLITVTERTSEIGIRRAVGASRGAILRQFLVEAVLIGGFGGLVGASVGVALTLTARRVLPGIAPAYGIPVLSMEAVALAFGLSLLVSLLAGTYPAIRAARLHPWDALRH
jgi:putative ABC transport system permease protein